MNDQIREPLAEVQEQFKKVVVGGGKSYVFAAGWILFPGEMYRFIIGGQGVSTSGPN